MPDTITQFEDIRLRDYFNQSGCKKGLFNEEISSTEDNNHLFKKYISSINKFTLKCIEFKKIEG